MRWRVKQINDSTIKDYSSWKIWKEHGMKLNFLVPKKKTEIFYTILDELEMPESF